MSQKREKNKILKNILHYFIILLILGALAIAYYFRVDIQNFFTAINIGQPVVDGLIHFVPKVIYSIEIIGLMYLVLFVINLIIRANIGFTDKSKTLFKVIASIFRWVVIVFTLFWILGVLGVNITALIASAGVITLIVGLAAQSLISDILSGIFIIVEGEYVIGDIVVIDGWRGTIKNIGVRTTEIQDIAGNVKIINNSEIKTVVNLTNFKSLARVQVFVASSENLKEVEDLFASKLPEIQASLSIKTDVIQYKGVQTIDNNGMALLYTAKCLEEDVFQVQREMNQQFKYIMDQNHISNNEPLVIFDRTEEFRPRQEQESEK